MSLPQQIKAARLRLGKSQAEGDGLGPYRTEVQIGEADGEWYGRTTADAATGKNE